MPFFPKNAQDIVTESLQKLDQNTNITQMTPGGKARFFLETIGVEQAEQQTLFDQNLLQAFVQYADGKFLDFFGDMLNLPRLEPSHAVSNDDNFMFYVSNGTFGDLNGGLAFVIPAGTIVKTKAFAGAMVTPGLANQPVITYTTLQNSICAPDLSFIYVPVRATLEGKQASLPRNVLTQHEYSSYGLAQKELLRCTNQYAIDNGEERESDAAYRFRLLNIFKARTQAILAAIRIAALSIQGVSDILPVNAEQGPGSFSLYIKSVTPTTSPQLIEEVAISVGQVQSYGIRPFILAPNPIGLEFIAAVNWSTRATSKQIAEGYIAMRNELEEFLNNKDIGEEILIADIVDLLLASTSYAQSIGRNKPNTFEEVYVYRTDAYGTGSNRSLLLSDTVTPLYNERVILETSSRYRGIQFV